MRTAIRALAVLTCALPAALACAAPASARSSRTALDAPGLTIRSVALLGHHLRVSGLLPDAAGRAVRIERRAGAGWAEVATTTASRSGAFGISWVPEAVGQQRLRAVVDDADPEATASATTDAAVAATTVYRAQRATWYGPGFYGNRTACGIVLTRRTLGVAHRTLPCGTRVSVLYRGRAITVPVIDRGPYANGASWDLTSATAQALGLEQTDRIGVLRADRVPAPGAPGDPAPLAEPVPAAGGVRAP